RLGLKAGIYTVVGDDDQGRKALEVFQQEGVATDMVALDKEHGTNLSVVINYRGERTIFVYHEPRTYSLPDLADTTWVYLTSSSGGGVETLHGEVMEFLEKHPHVQMAFNPGTYQMKLGLEKLTPLLQRTALLSVNREEAVRILDTKT